MKTKIYYKPATLIEEVTRLSNNKIGSEWTYYDFINNLEKNNIDAATIVDKANAIAVIDGNHGESVMGDNIHFIKTLPETSNLIIDKLAHNNINFDIFTHQLIHCLIYHSDFKLYLHHICILYNKFYGYRSMRWYKYAWSRTKSTRSNHA